LPCIADEVLKVVPVAHKYGISLVLESCASKTQVFNYSLHEGSSTDALKWIELADEVEVS